MIPKDRYTFRRILLLVCVQRLESLCDVLPAVLEHRATRDQGHAGLILWGHIDMLRLCPTLIESTVECTDTISNIDVAFRSLLSIWKTRWAIKPDVSEVSCPLHFYRKGAVLVYSCFRNPCPKWKWATQKNKKFEKSSERSIDLQRCPITILSCHSGLEKHMDAMEQACFFGLVASAKHGLGQ